MLLNMGTVRLSTVLLGMLASVRAEKYGENHVAVSFDSEMVEQTAFPRPNTTLISPAFLRNAALSAG